MIIISVLSTICSRAAIHLSPITSCAVWMFSTSDLISAVSLSGGSDVVVNSERGLPPSLAVADVARELFYFQMMIQTTKSVRPLLKFFLISGSQMMTLCSSCIYSSPVWTCCDWSSSQAAQQIKVHSAAKMLKPFSCFGRLERWGFGAHLGRSLSVTQLSKHHWKKKSVFAWMIFHFKYTVKERRPVLTSWLHNGQLIRLLN